MNENDHNKKGGNGFVNGLLLGIIIGGAAVFFLGTDKGKKLLKVITEEGIDSFSNIKEMMEDEYEEMDGPEMVSSADFEEAIEEEVLNEPAFQRNGHAKHVHEHPHSMHHTAKKSHPQRFFKKATKRS